MRQPSNWISALFTLVCGGIIGVIGTLAHRATLTLGGWDAPVGIALGLLGVLAFLVGCRLLWESRIPAIAAALGVGIAQLVVTLQPDAGIYFAKTIDGVDGTWAVVPFLVAIVVAVVGRLPRRTVSAGADRIESPASPETGDRS